MLGQQLDELTHDMSDDAWIAARKLCRVDKHQAVVHFAAQLHRVCQGNEVDDVLGDHCPTLVLRDRKNRRIW